MADSPDKAAERWWARFLGGVRHPSQGVSHADVSSYWCVVEHKYRQLQAYSAEFRKAIQQSDMNRSREPKTNPRVPLITFTFHGTRGQNARRFIMFEVYPKDTDIKVFLEGLLEKINSKKSTVDIL